MLHDILSLSDFDAEVFAVMEAESKRQEAHIELIASENYVSKRVLAAQGSVLTNKYAEGYPGKRYYGGCQFVDKAEEIAIARAKALFHAEYANVQPHSGSQANAEVMMALLQPGDTILGMSLSHGGHLTHGSAVNFSGKWYRALEYGVDAKTGLIDYEQLETIAKKEKPAMIIAGFSAYSQWVDWKRIRAIADEVGAYMLADIAHVAGLIVTDLYPSPLPYAHVVTTTTHKTLRGPRGGMILSSSSEEIQQKLQKAVFPGMQGGPLMHVIAAKAVAFLEALDPSFCLYQKEVLKNAKAMAATFQKRGYPIVSGGTENHMFLVNLQEKGITGKEADALLGLANITANKNTVPNDPLSPFITSGIRIGTPAVTTRGFLEPEVVQVATWICDLLDNPQDLSLQQSVKEDAHLLCQQFPVYG